MRFPWLLSACIGFLSLSQELLWVRYVGFAYHAVPQAFSFVLMVYLFGIAAGALAGKRLCARTPRLYRACGVLLVVAGAVDMFGPLASAEAASHAVGILIYLTLIFLCAGMKGVVFPVAHHLGSVAVAGKVGKSVSRVYFLNIVGSALGPLITGFWLLDHVSLQTSMLIMGWLTALLGVACLAKEGSARWTVTAGLALLLLALAFVQPARLTTELAYRYVDTPVRRVIENRSGIIHSLAAAKGGGDYTYGANVYDGRANVDPQVNSNGLQRVFVLAALKPEPKDVLVIGLSSGAWARILTGFAGVERIEIVEINPGYLELIQDYPEISPVLRDPRVRVHVDDGRRWLKRNPNEHFDLIVMNTSYHWRSYSTNLLSEQFLDLVRAHLKPGGLITYNATGSPDVLKTAEAVFPFAFRYTNFVVASDQDFRPRKAEGEAALLKVTMDGKAVFDSHNPKDRDFIARTLSEPFASSNDDSPRAGRPAEVITDWNMISEFKYGQRFP